MAVNDDDRRDPTSRYNILRRDAHRCTYCGEPLAYERKDCTDRIRYGTRDHLVPRAKGGPNDPSNLVAACYPCNAFKQHLSVLTLLRKLLEGPLPWSKPSLIGRRAQRLETNQQEYNRWRKG